MQTSLTTDVLVPQPRALWDGIKGIPGSMQLVDIPRLRSTWIYGYITDGVKYLAAGAVVDAIRRSFLWLYNRVKLRYSTSAEFVLGDPSYEWIVLFLTENNVWKRTRDFRVSSKTSKLVYGVSVSADPEINGVADYVPSYESPQLFRWHGYWVEVQRFRTQIQGSNGQTQSSAAIFLTVFTRNLSILSELVEEAHRAYQRKVKPYVTVFLADSPSFGGSFLWNVKRKPHRPIESIILPDGVLDDLIDDAKRFFASESWYHRAGIPHRRGYLLYGPPGTGKSSTIHAVAGALNLEIHSFSLSAGFVDDGFLQRAIATIPKRSIVLVEDIDCALPSRDDDDDSDGGSPVREGRDRPGPVRRSGVTLSGLLNMIDGIGSEEGKLFFATTNHVDRLDPALLRPGRIDRRIRYTLATQAQARGLFARLFKDAEVDSTVSKRRKAFDDEFAAETDDQGSEGVEETRPTDGASPSADPAAPVSRPLDMDPEKIGEPVVLALGAPHASGQLRPDSDTEKHETSLDASGPPLANPPPTAAADPTLSPQKIADEQLQSLAQQFAAAMQDHEFSPAELQGYLLANRERPIAAAHDMAAWVRHQRVERREKARAKAERKERVRAARAARFQQQQQFGFPPFAGPYPGQPLPAPMLVPMGAPPQPMYTPPPSGSRGDDANVAAAPSVGTSPAPPAAALASPPSPVAGSPALQTPSLPPAISPSKLINGINET